MALCQSGDAKSGQQDWAGASGDYQGALSAWPDNQQALYGLARCAEATGDMGSALDYYRRAVYAPDPTPLRRRVREAYSSNAMPLVLLLDETGQAPEAVFVYDEMVRRMEYDPVDGSLMLKVLLPQFGDGPGQEPYSPQEFEAMAHLAIGVDTNDMDQCRDETQQAVTLAPDSAAANYYWGKCLLGRDDVQAKKYLQKAVDLGDDRTAAAARVYLSVLD